MFPSEVRDVWQRFRRSVAGAPVASHEVELHFRVFYAPRHRAHSVGSDPPWSCGFPLTFADCARCAGPRFLAITGSSSRALGSLYRVRCCLTSARRPKLSCASLGISSSFATSVRRIHFPASFRRLAYGPPSVFLTPSTVFASPDLCGLVSSHCHVRGCSTGVCSRHSALPTRRRPLPS
jgi:hypothetical protein